MLHKVFGQGKDKNVKKIESYSQTNLTSNVEIQVMKAILTPNFGELLCGSPGKEGLYTPRRLFTRPY